MRWQDEDGNDHVGTPIKFTAEPAQINPSLPAVGENTADIVEKLDLTPRQREAILRGLDQMYGQ